MGTVIDEIGRILAGVRTFQVQARAAEMLVRLPVGGGRSQTVRLYSFRSPSGGPGVVRLQSRACVVTDPQQVRRALEGNDQLRCGGLALDTSTQPTALDVTYGLVLEQAMNPNVLFAALQQVAHMADVIEQRMGGGDVF